MESVSGKFLFGRGLRVWHEEASISRDWMLISERSTSLNDIFELPSEEVIRHVEWRSGAEVCT